MKEMKLSWILVHPMFFWKWYFFSLLIFPLQGCSHAFDVGGLEGWAPFVSNIWGPWSPPPSVVRPHPCFFLVMLNKHFEYREYLQKKGNICDKEKIFSKNLGCTLNGWYGIQIINKLYCAERSRCLSKCQCTLIW